MISSRDPDALFSGGGIRKPSDFATMAVTDAESPLLGEITCGTLLQNLQVNLATISYLSCRGNAVGAMPGNAVGASEPCCASADSSDESKSLVIEDLLALFLDIQTLGDRNLRKHAFSHIVQTIRKMSIIDPRHKSLKKIVVTMLEDHDIFPSFLLDYENIDDEDDSDSSSCDDEDSKQASQVVINKEAVYKPR